MGRQDEEISYATRKKNIKKFKIVFVGDQYVGKTSVIGRFINNTFDSETNPTIGIDFVSKNVNLGSKMLRLQLWDTAGQERFRSLIPNYVKDCQVALIIYDITSEESYEGLTRWIDFVKENRGDDAMIVVVGNKIDLEKDRKVDSKTVDEKCAQLGVKHYELSARTGEKVDKMFQQICAQLAEIGCQDMPTLQVQKSKLISNVSLQKQKSEGGVKKQEVAVVKNSTKLRNASEDERRIKQKDCC